MLIARYRRGSKSLESIRWEQSLNGKAETLARVFVVAVAFVTGSASAAQPAAVKSGVASGSLPAPLASLRPWFADYIPERTVGLINISVENAASHASSRPLYELIKSSRGFRQVYAVSATELRDMVLFVRATSPISSRIVFRTRSPISMAALNATGWVQFQSRTHAGRSYSIAKNGKAYFVADEHTFVLDDEPLLQQFLEQPRAQVKAMPTWLDDLGHVNSRGILVALNLETLSEVTNEAQSANKELERFSRLLNDGATLIAGLTVDNRLKAQAILRARDDESGVRLEQVVKDARTFANQILPNDSQPTSIAGLLKSLGPAANELVQSAQINRDAKRIQIQCDADVDTIRCRILLTALQQHFDAAVLNVDAKKQDQLKFVESAVHLDAIAAGMFKYHKKFGFFPPAVILGPDGKTQHSWRVAILPFLEEQDLFEQYALNEPWDSPNNQKLLLLAPDYYRAPDEKPDSPNTSYFVITGKGTIFEGSKGTSAAEVTDGMPNTMLVVESRRDVPWTKPEDISYDSKAPLPPLGGIHAKQFSTVFGNGDLRGFPTTFDPQKIKAMFTKSAGDAVELGALPR
jgi:hypothetical protein